MYWSWIIFNSSCVVTRFHLHVHVRGLPPRISKEMKDKSSFGSQQLFFRKVLSSFARKRSAGFASVKHSCLQGKWVDLRSSIAMKRNSPMHQKTHVYVAAAKNLLFVMTFAKIFIEIAVGKFHFSTYTNDEIQKAFFTRRLTSTSIYIWAYACICDI